MDVLVQSIRAGQLLLDRNELLARIALVGKEEQARVQPPETVRAVDEVVAAAQQLRTVVELRVREPDVRVDRNLRRTVGSLGGEVDRVELLGLADRRAGTLAAAD